MAVSVQKAVDDILECPICIETMNDTRVLPCIHTFCLKCIQKYGDDTIRDEQISCPCCRNSCPVPGGGLEELPKNILVEKLLEIRTSLVETTASNLQCSNGQDSCVMIKNTSSSRLCQIPCHNGKSNSSTLANGYCTECKSYMCSDCWKGHTQQSGTGSHLVLPIGCSEHPDRSLEFYCKTCKMTICDACSSLKHRRHKCSSLSGYVNSLQSEIKLHKSQVFHKEALELENQTLKSQISHTEALKRENQTLKLRLTNYQSEVEIFKAEEALTRQLKNEIESLKTKIAELSQQTNNTEPTPTEFRHLSSLRSWISRKNDCRVIHSCEQVMLLCRSCKNELCLTCFRLGLILPVEHKDGARSFLVLIAIILMLAVSLMYGSPS